MASTPRIRRRRRGPPGPRHGAGRAGAPRGAASRPPRAGAAGGNQRGRTAGVGIHQALLPRHGSARRARHAGRADPTLLEDAARCCPRRRRSRSLRDRARDGQHRAGGVRRARRRSWRVSRVPPAPARPGRGGDALMYGQRPLADLRWVLRGIAANQVAWLFPERYVRMTGHTGRGAAESSVRQIADYFWSCFYDYFEILGIPASDIGRYLKGKTVLEYGPGDVPAVAFLMLAHGADAAVCVDRFELYRPSPASAEVLGLLLDDLEGAARLRGEVCFRTPLDPASGLAEPSFRYVCQDYGLSGLRDEADLIISRAALEYANDLSATFADMRAALRADGIAIHKVDLAGQRCNDDHPLSFLTYPRVRWWAMCSQKNTVNRWRIDYYRRLVVDYDLETVSLEPTALADRRLADEVRPRLASCFRGGSGRDLSWLGFSLGLREPPTRPAGRRACLRA